MTITMTAFVTILGLVITATAIVACLLCAIISRFSSISNEVGELADQVEELQKKVDNDA